MTNRLSYITHFSILFALTLTIQIFGFPQPVTGPLVNMMLYLTGSHLGMSAGILLGILTPLIALWRGELPAILAPMAPFIMFGNALLVIGFKIITTKLTICFTSENNSWITIKAGLGIITGAFLKFLFFFAGVGLVIPYILKNPTAQKVASAMLSIAQLITAIIDRKSVV